MPESLKWLGLSALVLIADQLTKFAVTSMLVLGDRVSVLPFFDFVFVLNPGAAFSFLADHSGWQRWFFVVLALAVIAWLVVLLCRKPPSRLFSLSYALIIGGAIGNVVDRLLHGAVIDFLYFYVGRYGWPAFNVADSAITVGAALMVWAEFRGGAKLPAKHQDT